MSEKPQKSKIKGFFKVIVYSLLAIMLFLNVNVTLQDNDNQVQSDISVAGLEMQIFEASYAENPACWNAYLACMSNGRGNAGALIGLAWATGGLLWEIGYQSGCYIGYLNC